jgi:nucleoside-diphosphate-sugar epimerase
MRILVTGGMGDVGRPIVKWLLEKGHEVRVLDLHCETPIEGADCRIGTITDFASLHEHMEGMEGVIHLAAYRVPGMAPETELFHVNVDGTFNIFRAAADAGIKRVVCASSINAFGYNYGIKFPPDQLRYFPLDEEHPTYTTDPYSFSKQINEEIGKYFWRREGISSLLLRFPAVCDPRSPVGFSKMMLVFAEQCRNQTKQVMSLPEPQRSQRVKEIVSAHEARARSRMFEAEAEYDDSPEALDWMQDLAIPFGRSNFWTILDARDAAQAAEKGLLADYEGSHAAFISDDQNLVGLPTRELAAVWFPEVTTWKRPVSGAETLVSIDLVRELIGFEVNYPYRKS